jgi:hypothetical protein
MGDFDRRLLRKPGERSFPRKPLLIRSPPVSDSISGSVVSFRGIDDGDEDDDKLGVDDFLKEKSDMSALVGCFFFSDQSPAALGSRCEQFSSNCTTDNAVSFEILEWVVSKE